MTLALFGKTSLLIHLFLLVLFQPINGMTAVIQKYLKEE